ncbi:ankyrin repeat domain-containing protein [Actinoplanes sp. NPDC051513]|uniref:ankyrin repeat domain-containing protein n=1 Tax=Actinoplanes sp. NPDC051513 TaxID=3363908 RepID=UPI0037BA0123
MRFAATQHASTKRSLFTAIRGDARLSSWSLRALADRHGVHRRTVRQALTSPIPPPRKQHRARGSRLDPFKPVIDALLQEGRGRRYGGHRTIQDIHSVLVNEYGMTGVSYSTLRDYVTSHCRRLVLPAVRPVDSITPAHQAVEEQNLVLLRDLIDAGHDIEDHDGDGWTLLRHAVAVEQDHHRQTGEPAHADMTAFLLARGANPHRTGPDGATPLQEAEDRGHWLAAEIIHAWTGRPRPTANNMPA